MTFLELVHGHADCIERLPPSTAEAIARWYADFCDKLQLPLSGCVRENLVRRDEVVWHCFCQRSHLVDFSLNVDVSDPNHVQIGYNMANEYVLDVTAEDLDSQAWRDNLRELLIKQASAETLLANRFVSLRKRVVNVGVIKHTDKVAALLKHPKAVGVRVVDILAGGEDVSRRYMNYTNYINARISYSKTSVAKTVGDTIGTARATVCVDIVRDAEHLSRGDALKCPYLVGRTKTEYRSWLGSHINSLSRIIMSHHMLCSTWILDTLHWIGLAKIPENIIVHATLHNTPIILYRNPNVRFDNNSVARNLEAIIAARETYGR